MLVSTAQIEVQNTRRISVGTSTTSCLANGGLQHTRSTTPHFVAKSSALYFFCNNLTVIAAPPGLLISTILFLQQSHCYCSPTWALVLPTGLKMNNATPRMIQIYHRSPHGHPAGQTQMLVIYHQLSQPHLFKRTVLVSIDPQMLVIYHQPSQPHLVNCTVLVSIDICVIALTLAASIICSAIIVR